MISGLLPHKSQLAINFKNVSSQISNSRVILRLLDDYSMLVYTLSYGLGRQVWKYLTSNKNNILIIDFNRKRTCLLEYLQ